MASELTWPDHHRFTARDVARIRRAVVESGASGIVTTEKDMVRLLPFRPLPFAAAWQRLDLRIEPADAFGVWITQRLREVDTRVAARVAGAAA